MSPYNVYVGLGNTKVQTGQLNISAALVQYTTTSSKNKNIKHKLIELDFTFLNEKQKQSNQLKV